MLNEIIANANKNIEHCWRHPKNEMYQWAKQWELELGNRHHGLGDLNKPCPSLPPGTTCYACELEF